MKSFETVLLRLSKSDDDSSLNDTAKSLLNADLESVICSEFASKVFGTCLKKAELFEKGIFFFLENFGKLKKRTCCNPINFKPFFVRFRSCLFVVDILCMCMCMC